MKPGELPYGDRPHHVFSRSIELPERPNLHIERGDGLEAIDRIKRDSAGPVYLCGGGKFAGFLARHGRIDRLRLKLAPLIYGEGIPLFAGLQHLSHWELVRSTHFGNGHLLLDYRPV